MPSPEPNKPRKRPPQTSYVMTKAAARAARAWWVVDATDKPLGRLASQVILKESGAGGSRARTTKADEVVANLSKAAS